MSIDFTCVDWKAERQKYLTDSYWNLCKAAVPSAVSYLSLLLDQIQIIASSEDIHMARSTASREHHITVPMTFSHPRDTQRS